MHIVIIGGSTVGQTLAAQLDTTYNEVGFINEDERGLTTTVIDGVRESVSADLFDVDLGLDIVSSTNVLAAALAEAVRTAPESDTDNQDLQQEKWV